MNSRRFIGSPRRRREGVLNRGGRGRRLRRHDVLVYAPNHLHGDFERFDHAARVELTLLPFNTLTSEFR
jgi:hypothetical protein